eukprot:138559-Hanusia_phi.AAC.1
MSHFSICSGAEHGSVAAQVGAVEGSEAEEDEEDGATAADLVVLWKSRILDVHVIAVQDALLDRLDRVSAEVIPDALRPLADTRRHLPLPSLRTPFSILCPFLPPLSALLLPSPPPSPSAFPSHSFLPFLFPSAIPLASAASPPPSHSSHLVAHVLGRAHGVVAVGEDEEGGGRVHHERTVHLDAVEVLVRASDEGVAGPEHAPQVENGHLRVDHRLSHLSDERQQGSKDKGVEQRASGWNERSMAGNGL